MGLGPVNDDETKNDIRRDAAGPGIAAVHGGMNGAAVCADTAASSERVAHLKHQSRSEGGKLDPIVQAKLGETLRIAYQALVETPVPEKFLTLLERLATAEKRH